MHILIGLITAVAGLIWALYSLQKAGINLNSFNPFFWYRRHQWRQKLGDGPLYTLNKPIDVAAVILLGIAKLEGEISKEQKRSIITIFSKEFHLSQDGAKDLFASSSYLLQHENNFLKNIKKIMARTAELFDQEQIASIIELMKKVAEMESPISTDQDELMKRVIEVLSPEVSPSNKWH